MKILISNDDGYRADGLRALTDALSQIAQTTVVAPDRNRSGASNSLTLDVPLRVMAYDEGKYLVANGTPTDCVHLAISGLFEFEHDMVVSGINDGANLGDDVLYSGTVAAACVAAAGVSAQTPESRYNSTSSSLKNVLEGNWQSCQDPSTGR